MLFSSLLVLLANAGCVLSQSSCLDSLSDPSCRPDSAFTAEDRPNLRLALVRGDKEMTLFDEFLSEEELTNVLTRLTRGEF